LKERREIIKKLYGRRKNERKKRKKTGLQKCWIDEMKQGTIRKDVKKNERINEITRIIADHSGRAV
jgi:hypothetical protein